MDSNDREFDGFEPDGGEAIFLSTVLSVMDSKADVTDGLEHHPFDGYDPCSSPWIRSSLMDSRQMDPRDFHDGSKGSRWVRT